MRKCFADVDICFKEAIMKSKNVHFIHTNFDKAKYQIFKHGKKYFFAISIQVQTTINSTRLISYPLDHKDFTLNTLTFTTFENVEQFFLKKL